MNRQSSENGRVNYKIQTVCFFLLALAFLTANCFANLHTTSAPSNQFNAWAHSPSVANHNYDVTGLNETDYNTHNPPQNAIGNLRCSPTTHEALDHQLTPVVIDASATTTLFAFTNQQFLGEYSTAIPTFSSATHTASKTPGGYDRLGLTTAAPTTSSIHLSGTTGKSTQKFIYEMSLYRAYFAPEAMDPYGEYKERKIGEAPRYYAAVKIYMKSLVENGDITQKHYDEQMAMAKDQFGPIYLRIERPYSKEPVDDFFVACGQTQSETKTITLSKSDSVSWDFTGSVKIGAEYETSAGINAGGFSAGARAMYSGELGLEIGRTGTETNTNQYSVQNTTTYAAEPKCKRCYYVYQRKVVARIVRGQKVLYESDLFWTGKYELRSIEVGCNEFCPELPPSPEEDPDGTKK